MSKPTDFVPLISKFPINGESSTTYSARVLTNAQQMGYNFSNHISLSKQLIRKGYFKKHPALEQECEDVGIPVDSVSHYWHKGKHFSIFSKQNGKGFEDLKDELIAEMRSYSPKYPTIKRDKIKDRHLLVVDPADIHIGKLASSFETGDPQNNRLIVDRVHAGVDGLINKAQGFLAEKILLIIGNDILHVDTPRRTTTSGTPQDTEGMWYENFLTAKSVYVETIEKLMQIADVKVMYNPSNHDYMSGFFLADTLATWFRNSKNVAFDVSIAHRKYEVFYENIIGTTHGDGARESDLPLLMAQECKAWSECKHRYFYTHHIHHKKAKDYGSVCVESLRSPSGTDSWHHRNGYQHSPKAVEAYIHHPNYGQIARLTHIFNLLVFLSVLF